MTILVLAPHPDDESIGMGGTIATLAEQGERVVVVVFSGGEATHVWQKQEAIRTTRQRECLKASKILGVADVVFFELADMSLANEIVERDVESQLKEIIELEKPEMVFTCAIDDVYPDHRAVARLSFAVKDKYFPDLPVWMYTVWNPLHITHREQPRMVVDVTKTFPLKWRAIQAYQSQKLSTFQLIPTVILRGFIHGLRHRVNMAEVFVKAP